MSKERNSKGTRARKVHSVDSSKAVFYTMGLDNLIDQANEFLSNINTSLSANTKNDSTCSHCSDVSLDCIALVA